MLSNHSSVKNFELKIKTADFGITSTSMSLE